MARQRRGLKLADNPVALQEEEPMVAEPEDMEFEEEQPYEEEELEGGMYRARVSRGRKVSGPRTKLASAGQVNRIERAIVDLADTQTSLAKSVATLAKAVINRADDDDDDSKEDKSAKTAKTAKAQKAQTSKATSKKSKKSQDMGSDFQPYGDTEDEGDPESQDPEESTMNEPGLQDPKGATELKNSGVKKDDASGNFGEKDSDIPGNREAGIDEKDKSAEEYLIQGGPGDGPGPVSKAVRTEIDSAVSSVLAKHGILRKSRGPAPGNSQVETGQSVEIDGVFEQARNMSFRQLNKIREESGLIQRSLV